MSYTKSLWADNDLTKPVSADRMSNLETQYDAALAEAANRFVAKGATTINVLDYGAVGDGVADDTTAATAAIQAATPGSTIEFPRGKTFRLAGAALTNLDASGNPRSLQFKLDGATLVKDTDSRIFDFKGGWEAPFSVSAATASTVLDDGGDTLNTVVLTITGTAPWKRGDIVKLFSSDIIPGSRSDDGTNPASASRTGQFFTVRSVATNSIELLGVLRDPVTANIKVSRILNVTVRVQGGTLDVSDAVIAASGLSDLIQFNSLVNPEIRGTIIKRSCAQVISFSSCFGYLAENVAIRWAWNDAVTRFGYGINDAGSSFGKAIGCHFSQVRHGWTDSNTTCLVGDTDPTKYGRTVGARIESCTVDSPTSAAFDTHLGGDSNSFVNCIAINAVIGFSLRGRRHQVIGGQARNTGTAVRVFTESAGGDSWGHVVDGLQVDGTTFALVEAAVNWSSGTPNFGVLDLTRTLSLRNITARNVVGDAFVLTNIKVDMKNIIVEYGGNVGAEGNSVTNCRVYGENVRFDYFNTTGSGQTLFNCATDPLLEFRGLRLVGFSSLSSRVVKVFATTPATVLRVTDMDLDFLPGTAVYDMPTTASWIDYRVGAAPGASSRFITIPQISIATATALRPVQRTRAEAIVMEVNCTTAATLAALPGALVQGQTLSIVNTGTAILTIANGGAGNTLLASGANTTIPAGSSMLMEANSTGVWRQVKTV